MISVLLLIWWDDLFCVSKLIAPLTKIWNSPIAAVTPMLIGDHLACHWPFSLSPPAALSSPPSFSLPELPLVVTIWAAHGCVDAQNSMKYWDEMLWVTSAHFRDAQLILITASSGILCCEAAPGSFDLRRSLWGLLRRAINFVKVISVFGRLWHHLGGILDWFGKPSRFCLFSWVVVVHKCPACLSIHLFSRLHLMLS